MLWRRPYSTWPRVASDAKTAVVSGGSGASPENWFKVTEFVCDEKGGTRGDVISLRGSRSGSQRIYRPCRVSKEGGKVAIQLVQQALTFYDLPRNVTVALVSLSENEIYKVETPSGKKWALRLQRPGYQSTDSLASEIAWLLALRKDGVVDTPVPVAGLNGEWIQIVAERNLVLFEWENGSQPEIEMDLRQCFRTLGAVTARLHTHSRTWNRPAGFERFTWDFGTALGESRLWGHWGDGLGMNATRLDLFGQTAALVRDRLAHYGRRPDRFGLAHCDLRILHLLLDRQALKVIDFDDCGFGWFMYDAAASLSFYEHLPQVSLLIEHWLDGYRTVSAIAKAEEEEIPTFLMMRRLLLIAWVGSHSETSLAQSLGVSYTQQTDALCTVYLKRFG